MPNLRTKFLIVPAYGVTNRPPLVAAEIVHDDDVAGRQGRDQHLLDIEPEPLAVDRSIDQPWRVQAIMAQCRQEGHGLPVAVRDFGMEPLPDRCPAAQRRHVCLGPGLVDEHQA